MCSPPDNERGRPLVTSQESGPNTHCTDITVTSITELAGTGLKDGLWCVSDLPAYLASNIRVNRITGCWEWTGRTDKDGYGRYSDQMAHREVWRELVGPIPPKLVLDHREDWGCATKACSFPGHLLPVTQRVNSTRAGAGGVGAANIRKDRCGTCGTAFDLLNTYYKPDGARDCRVCIARRVREYRERYPDRVRETRRRRRERLKRQRGEFATVITLTGAGFTPEAVTAMLRAG